MTRLLGVLVLLFLAFGFIRPAGAILSIDIRQGVRDPLPLAVVPFAWEGDGRAPLAVSDVVAEDLRRSGLFRLVEEQAFISQPRRPQGVRYKDWRLVGADALVIGRMQPVGGGRVEVRFRFFDVYSQRQLAGVRYVVEPEALRDVAHRIANTIHKKLVGWSGAFNTRLAYVVKNGKDFALRIADADGARSKTILTSQQPILSPTWSPDGKALAYVSFEKGRPLVFRHQLETGKRAIVADFPGINSAPAFAPGGNRLALSLSKDGNPEIYILELGSGALQRVTHSRAIDTEPTWGPEGDALVFTSDRGGSPQLYRLTLGKGEPRRLTFEGEYNAAPNWSPKGDRIAFITGDGSRFAIGVLDLDSGRIRTVTKTKRQHESPSFAPNGHLILYAAENAKGAEELAVVSVGGHIHRRLRSEGKGDVREPAWSPN